MEPILLAAPLAFFNDNSLKGLLMISLLLAAALPLTGLYNDQGCPENTKENRHRLHEFVTKDAQGYLNCKKDSDCFYMPVNGGFITNRDGVAAISACFSALSRKMFPSCFTPPNSDKTIHGVVLTEQTPAPNRITCQKRTCKPVMTGEKIMWQHQWDEAVSKNLFKIFGRTPDEFCLNIIKGL